MKTYATIAHPHLWAVRGNDANGQPVPAEGAGMTSAERDRHPFNALLGGWADPNLPIIFTQGRSGKAGVMITHNQQDAHHAVTYAPIAFAEGGYGEYGVFGVLTIGANTAEFHESAATVATAIDGQLRRLQIAMALVGVVGVGLLVLTGLAVSRMLVRPLTQLTAAARRLEQGEFDEAQLTAIRRRRFSDEVTVLANVFAEMGRQVVRRERQLRTQIADLHIQVDSRRRQQQVDEITETDYFRNLRETATRLRSRTPHEPPTEGGSA